MAKNNPTGKSRLTLVEIAKKAGVSIATVSNVLNNKGRMSQETSDRIFRIVQELDADGGAAGPSYREGQRQSGGISLVSVDQSNMLNHFSFHLHLIQGIQSVLERNELSLKISACENLGDYIKETRGSLGAVVVGFPGEPERLFEEVGIPIVWALGSTGVEADAVQEDNRGIARLAAEHFVARGHGTVGYIEDERVESVGLRGWYFAHFMRAAGGRAVAAVGRDLFASRADPMSIDVEQTGRLVEEILGSNPRPTALFVPGDRLCSVVYSVLERMGVGLPGDLEILSCNNDIPYLAGMSPRPATISLNVEVIGRVAAEIMIRRIRNSGADPVRTLVRPSMVLPGGVGEALYAPS